MIYLKSFGTTYEKHSEYTLKIKIDILVACDLFTGSWSPIYTQKII